MTFRQGSIEALAGERLDVVVSGLVLNFLPDLDAAVAAFAGAVPGGTVAAYVWDYQAGNQMLHRFWQAASAVAGHSVSAAENTAFAPFHPTGLAQTWERAGLREVATGALEIELVFEDFDDYWSPFLGAQGPAPSYLATLTEDDRALVREDLARGPAPGRRRTRSASPRALGRCGARATETVVKPGSLILVP